MTWLWNIMCMTYDLVSDASGIDCMAVACSAKGGPQRHESWKSREKGHGRKTAAPQQRPQRFTRTLLPASPSPSPFTQTTMSTAMQSGQGDLADKLIKLKRKNHPCVVQNRIYYFIAIHSLTHFSFSPCPVHYELGRGQNVLCLSVHAHHRLLHPLASPHQAHNISQRLP